MSLSRRTLLRQGRLQAVAPDPVEYLEETRLRPLLLIDEAQELLPSVFAEIRLLASTDFDSRAFTKSGKGIYPDQRRKPGEAGAPPGSGLAGDPTEPHVQERFPNNGEHHEKVPEMDGIPAATLVTVVKVVDDKGTPWYRVALPEYDGKEGWINSIALRRDGVREVVSTKALGR